MQHRLVLALATGLAASSLWAADTISNDPQRVRSAAAKAVTLMEKSMGMLTPNVPCASCHHNMIPLWALSTAKNHGVAINDELFKKVVLKTYGYFNDVDRAIQGSQYVDPTLEGAEQLAFARDYGIADNFVAQLHTARLARMQKPGGYWQTFDARPPQTYSLFMTTGLAVKSLLAQSAPSQKADVAQRVDKAREWLFRNQPVSTEDATFRLLGLYWAGAPAKQVQAAAKALAAMQRAEDGGWTQVPGRGDADAYATGQALAALQMTGTAKADAVARGVGFLLQTQAEDGSWLVKTRLHEVAPISPPYMETGFPYGKHQIMSMLGTTWAVMALSLTLPVEKMPAAEITEIRPQVEPWMETVAFGSLGDVKKVDVNAVTAKGSTPLMLATIHPARVAALLENGADVNAKAKSGLTALAVSATWNGAAPVMRQLIAKGASAKPVKGVEYNSNPLVFTAFVGDVDATKVLLDAGANPKQGMLLEGMVPMSPLTAAVTTEATEVLAEFLRRGVDPNTVEDIPLLSWAAIANRATSAKVLLAGGADPEMKDKYQWTPLQHARSIEHDKALVEPLIQTAIAAKKQSSISSSQQ